MKRNVLNDLDGSRWLYFTNTIWKTDYPPDATHRLRKAHGAMKPPQAMAELVEFFTRKGQTVRSVRFGLNVTGYLKRLSGGQLCVAASNGLVVVMSAMGVPIWKVRVPFGIKGRPAGPISQRLVVPTSRGIVWVAPPI